MKTACTWPWKPAASKECVTAHMPNGLVPKMDGADRVTRGMAMQSGRRLAWVRGRWERVEGLA